MPVAVAGDSLTLSLDGGTSGVRVGILGDANRTVEACVPITGKHSAAVVSWKGRVGSYLGMLYGAAQLELVIPADATVFAFSFLESPGAVPTGVRVKATATKGSPGLPHRKFTKAWDGDTCVTTAFMCSRQLRDVSLVCWLPSCRHMLALPALSLVSSRTKSIRSAGCGLTLRKRFRDTFFDGVSANGGYTEAKLAHAASVSGIRFFPCAQYTSGRYVGGTFVGFTQSGGAVPLATIGETPSLKWQLLNVTARTEVVSVRYNSPDGGFGNIAEIEVYGRK